MTDMVTVTEATEFLLDRDSTTRDVTFTPVTIDSLRAFMVHMFAEYRVVAAHDNDGNNVTPLLAACDFDAVFGKNNGFIHTTLASDVALIRNVQAFVDWETEDGLFCVELSFYPDDIATEYFTLGTFIGLLTQWNEKLNAADYFVRYENASWTLYDSVGLGVIFTRKRPPTD